MIVDFHSHTFPEKIAAAAIEKLSQASHSRPFTDGTEEGLCRHMQMSGITHSVILPVATAARQVVRINDASARINEASERGLLSFAAMHPDFEDPRGELVRVRDLGFRGIKIHPVYQGRNLDSPAFLRILEICAELGLLVVTHAGVDIGFPGVVHASPAMALHALREIGCSPSRTHVSDRTERNAFDERLDEERAGANSSEGFRLILAHMGGWRNWDEVAVLAPAFVETGVVMIDTAFSTGNFPALPDGYWKEGETRMLGERAFAGIIRAFGAERVLFGSDSPWGSQSEMLAFLNRAELETWEREMILWKNAARLLGLPNNQK